MQQLFLLISVSLHLPPAAARHVATSTPVAATPPMGWNSWATFGCGVNETILTDAADQMHTLGLASAGYVYVNTDDCWMDAARDAKTHEQVPTNGKFPGGFKNMIDCTPWYRLVVHRATTLTLTELPMLPSQTSMDCL